MSQSNASIRRSNRSDVEQPQSVVGSVLPSDSDASPASGERRSLLSGSTNASSRSGRSGKGKKKEGLSCGAIAGISVGAVVAGMAGGATAVYFIADENKSLERNKEDTIKERISVEFRNLKAGMKTMSNCSASKACKSSTQLKKEEDAADEAAKQLEKDQELVDLKKRLEKQNGRFLAAATAVRRESQKSFIGSVATLEHSIIMGSEGKHKMSFETTEAEAERNLYISKDRNAATYSIREADGNVYGTQIVGGMDLKEVLYVVKAANIRQNKYAVTAEVDENKARMGRFDESSGELAGPYTTQWSMADVITAAKRVMAGKKHVQETRESVNRKALDVLKSLREEGKLDERAAQVLRNLEAKEEAAAKEAAAAAASATEASDAEPQV